MIWNVHELRRLCLQEPLAPAPITRLGYLALLSDAPDGAERYFSDALRLDVTYAPALLGAQLLEFLRHGTTQELERLAALTTKTGFDLPERVQHILREATAPVPGGARSTRPAGRTNPFELLPVRDVALGYRARDMRGEPPPPLPGRKRVVEDLLRATAGNKGQSAVLVGGRGVDLNSVCDCVLPDFLARHAERTGGGSLWELTGPVPSDPATDAFENILDQLRAARHAGHFLFHRRLGEALGGLNPGQILSLLETGGLLTAIPAHLLEQYLSAIPELRFRLASVPVEPILPQETLRAFTEENARVSSWCGEPVGAATLQECVALADHYVVHTALPESAVTLLSDACGAKHDGAADTPSASDRLHRAALTAARLPEDCLAAKRIVSVTECTDALSERIGSHRSACLAVAESIAPTLSVGGIKHRRNLPDAAFLFLGPAGVGKRTLALQLARLLYGEGAFLAVDLALYGQEPGALFALPGKNQGPAIIDSFLSHHPFALVYLDHVDQAWPSVQTMVGDALATGRLRIDDSGPSLRRTLFVLAIDGQVERSDLGFISDEVPGSDLAWIRERYFPAVPGLLRTVLVVPFEPLKDNEYAEAVRRRLDRVVVRRLKEDRGIHVAIDETAVRCLASQAKASGLGGERIDEVIESVVLGPLWQILTPGLEEVAITADRSGLRWTTKPDPPSRGPVEQGHA